MANNCSCEKAVLKQGINMLMPVEFEGLDLDTVESIDFILKQWNTTWEFSYPSEIASRRSGSTNIVDIVWRESDTWRFKKEQDIHMDTKITLVDSWQNPKTPIVEFRMDKTLFPVPSMEDNTESGDSDGGTG